MPWSIRNFLATHNLLAVSANLREPAMNTEQELDTVFLADVSTILNYQAIKFPNREELTGKEEPDRVHDLRGKVAGTLSFSRAQPQHLAFLLAYGLGEAASVAVGAGGYRHTVTPRSGEVDECRSNPSFTAAMRFGRQVLKRRFASCFIEQVRLELARDGWAKAAGSVRGSGKVSDNSQLEEVGAAWNAPNLALAANGVEGATATERLSNVQGIRALNPATQAWEDVSYQAVSGAAPAGTAQRTARPLAVSRTGTATPRARKKARASWRTVPSVRANPSGPCRRATHSAKNASRSCARRVAPRRDRSTTPATASPATAPSTAPSTPHPGSPMWTRRSCEAMTSASTARPRAASEAKNAGSLRRRSIETAGWGIRRPCSRREERGELRAPDRPLPELSKNPVHRSHREHGRRSDLDPDGSATPRAVDQQAGRTSRGTGGTVARAARKVVIGRERPAVAIRDLQIGLAHAPCGSPWPFQA